MKSYTAADLHALARGRPIDSEVFRAIFADAGAVADLARLLQARELLEPAEPEAVVPPADMDVTLDELTRYAERRLHDPARVAVVERFLGKHFPEALHDPAAPVGEDTHVEMRAGEDTVVHSRPKIGEPPRREPPGDAGKQA